MPALSLFVSPSDTTRCDGLLGKRSNSGCFFAALTAACCRLICFIFVLSSATASPSLLLESSASLSTSCRWMPHFGFAKTRPRLCFSNLSGLQIAPADPMMKPRFLPSEPPLLALMGRPSSPRPLLLVAPLPVAPSAV